jgi:hypothetical protein
VVAFRASKCHKGGRESDDSDIAEEAHTPDIITEAAVHAELEESICFYKRGSRKQSPILGTLQAIGTNMHALSSWLEALRDNRHRSPVLCTSALKSSPTKLVSLS